MYFFHIIKHLSYELFICSFMSLSLLVSVGLIMTFLQESAVQVVLINFPLLLFLLFSSFNFLSLHHPSSFTRSVRVARKQEIIKITEQLIEAVNNGDFEAYT